MTTLITNPMFSRIDSDKMRNVRDLLKVDKTISDIELLKNFYSNYNSTGLLEPLFIEGYEGDSWDVIENIPFTEKIEQDDEIFYVISAEDFIDYLFPNEKFRQKFLEDIQKRITEKEYQYIPKSFFLTSDEGLTLRNKYEYLEDFQSYVDEMRMYSHEFRPELKKLAKLNIEKYVKQFNKKYNKLPLIEYVMVYVYIDDYIILTNQY